MSKYGVQKFKTTVSIANGQTVGQSTGNALNGVLRGIIVKAPQLDGSVTLTLDIIDEDGSVTMFSRASIAENQNSVILHDAQTAPNALVVPLSGVYTIQVTASGAQSGDNDSVPIVLLIDRG